MKKIFTLLFICSLFINTTDMNNYNGNYASKQQSNIDFRESRPPCVEIGCDGDF